MRKFFARLSFGDFTASQKNIRYDHSLEVDHDLYYSNATTSTNNIKTWNPEFASDPSAWEKEFLSCWDDLKKLIFLNLGSNNIEVLNKVYLWTLMSKYFFYLGAQIIMSYVEFTHYGNKFSI